MSRLYSNFSIVASFCALLFVNAVGCSGDDYSLAPVNGVVVANDEPVIGIEVVFYPKPTKENATPGPYAAGKTDSEGKFTLIARDGSAGAVVGANRIGFELPGASRSALQGAKNSLRELKPGVDDDAIKIVKERIATIERTKKQFSMIDPNVLNSRSMEITVPPQGLPDLNLDISKE